MLFFENLISWINTPWSLITIRLNKLIPNPKLNAYFLFACQV